MVRLMLVLAPVMCVLSGIGVSSILSTYMKNLDVARKDKKPKRADGSYPLKNEVSTFLTPHNQEYVFVSSYLPAPVKIPAFHKGRLQINIVCVCVTRLCVMVLRHWSRFLQRLKVT